MTDTAAAANTIDTAEVATIPAAEAAPVAPAAVTPPAAAAPELSMEAYRAALFKTQVAAKLYQAQSEGKTPEQMVQEIAADQLALAGALLDPEFVQRAGTAFTKAQHGAVANADLQTVAENDANSLKQILMRRAADARALAAEVVKPEYYTALASQTPPAADAPIVPSLAEVKMKETLDELRHEGKPQVLAHTDAIALGMHIEHGALAAAFAPDGLLYIPLMAAIQRQMPDAKNEHIHQMTTRWLSEREAPAKLTAELTGKNGAAIEQARRESLAAYPVAATNDNVAPVPVVTQPVQAERLAEKSIADLPPL